MNSDPSLPTRLKAEAPGLGHASQADIERRAAELAFSDGRGSFTDSDLALAAAELSGGTPAPAAPEVDPSLEQVTAWDDPPMQAGHRVGAAPFEDEGTVAERLVRDGIEEADHDIRVSSAEDAENR